VLSVDDETVNQQVVQSLLWAQDYELVQVVSGMYAPTVSKQRCTCVRVCVCVQ